jgi:hypothetical protein
MGYRENRALARLRGLPVRAANVTGGMACKRTGPPRRARLDLSAASPQSDLPQAVAARDELTDACRRARPFRSAQPHLPVASCA